jgi:hypothetical protein
MGQQKSMVLAYLLWLIVGAFGGHRFYLGRIKTGIALAVLLVLSVAASVGGSFYMMQAIENGAEIMDLALSVNAFTILTYSGSLLMLVWMVWYAVDLILIYFMVKKDRERFALSVDGQASQVFE